MRGQDGLGFGKRWLVCGMKALLTVLWQRMSCLVCVCVCDSECERGECHAKGFWRRKWSRKSPCCRGILLEQNDWYQETFLQDLQQIKTSMFDKSVDPLSKTNVCIVTRVSRNKCLQSYEYIFTLFIRIHSPLIFFPCFVFQEPQEVAVGISSMGAIYLVTILVWLSQ